jgi:hypothetical protein
MGKKKKHKNDKIKSCGKTYGAENIFAIVICITLTVLFAVCCFSADSLEHSDLTYEEAQRKSYTYAGESRNKHGIFLTVKEEDLPVIIVSIYRKKLDESALSSLEIGDTIDCFVIPTVNKRASYEAVEIRSGDKVILSLDGYNEADRENADLGKIVLPLLLIVSVILIPVCFYAYKKDVRILPRTR